MAIRGSVGGSILLLAVLASPIVPGEDAAAQVNLGEPTAAFPEDFGAIQEGDYLVIEHDGRVRIAERSVTDLDE